MRRHLLRRLLALSVAAAATVLASPAALAQSREPLRFGMAMPMTGSQAGFGVDFVKGARMAVADINARGGVNGRPLEMVEVDTQADTQLAIAGVNRLVHVNKVPVFLTGWSGVVKAVAPIANREKVLEFNVAASAPEIARLGEYVYTTFPLAEVDVTALATYTARTLGKKRAAVLYLNNETGIEPARLYKEAFEKAGGQVVAFEAYDDKATDYSGAILKVRAANPDVVHVHGLIVDIPAVIGQMRQLGLTQRVTSYGAAYNTKVIERLGSAAEGLIVTSLAPGAADNPNVPAWIERWKKTENRVPTALSYTQYTHDSAYLVADLFKWCLDKGLEPSGENMRKALLAIRHFDHPLAGALEIGDDHRVRKPVYLMTVDKGQFVPLATVK